MDRLLIEGLRATTLIGVRDWERQVRQTVVVDLELTVDAAAAAVDDALGATTDYGAVARRVTRLVSESAVHLVETLAEAIARCVLDEFGVTSVQVRLHKPGAVPNARDVVITIERSR